MDPTVHLTLSLHFLLLDEVFIQVLIHRGNDKIYHR